MSELNKRLRILAGMITMGEKITWGADSGIMNEAADEIDRLTARVRGLEALLRRYRDETPLGHQPHMIASDVDAALKGEG